MNRRLFLTLLVAAFAYGFLLTTIVIAEPYEYVPFDEFFETVEERDARRANPVQVCKYIDLDSVVPTYSEKTGKVVSFTYDTRLDACHRVRFEADI